MARSIAHWATSRKRRSRTTLWHWLDRAVAEGLVLHDGEGRFGSAYRYWNRSLEQKWEANPMLRAMAEAEDFTRRMLGGARE